MRLGCGVWCDGKCCRAGPVESNMLTTISVQKRVRIPQGIVDVVSWLARTESGWVRASVECVGGGWTI